MEDLKSDHSIRCLPAVLDEHLTSRPVTLHEPCLDRSERRRSLEHFTHPAVPRPPSDRRIRWVTERVGRDEEPAVTACRARERLKSHLRRALPLRSAVTSLVCCLSCSTWRGAGLSSACLKLIPPPFTPRPCHFLPHSRVVISDDPLRLFQHLLLPGNYVDELAQKDCQWNSDDKCT